MNKSKRSALSQTRSPLGFEKRYPLHNILHRQWQSVHTFHQNNILVAAVLIYLYILSLYTISLRLLKEKNRRFVQLISAPLIDLFKPLRWLSASHLTVAQVNFYPFETQFFSVWVNPVCPAARDIYIYYTYFPSAKCAQC